MIDLHCHLNLYPNPYFIADELESKKIFTLAVTNLPSHFEKEFPHIMKYSKIRLALGLHPLVKEFHAKEFDIFKKQVKKTSFIGEVGLDFSKEGSAFKQSQIEKFKFVLEHVNDRPRLLSLHSRGAEELVLELILQNHIKNAVFHWYSGSLKNLDMITEYGYYFSVNPAMIKSAKGKLIIERIPKHLILTETDGPFTQVIGRPSKPEDVRNVLDYLSNLWNEPITSVNNQILNNFKNILSEIKKQ